MSVFQRTILNQNINYQKISFDPGPNSNQTTKLNGAYLPLVLKENPSGSNLNSNPEVVYGVPSFINPYALISFPNKYSTNQLNQLIDNPGSQLKFSSPDNSIGGLAGVGNIDPSVYNLVNKPPDGSASFSDAKTPYRYTDFLYCKYYGVIPNNYLITLRRYGAPTYDNLALPLAAGDAAMRNDVQYTFKPIAQAVTWMGEETENKISEMLGFEVNMTWDKFKSEVSVVQGNEQEAADSGSKLITTASKFLTITSGIFGGNVNSQAQKQNAQFDPYANGPYSHRVFGPVNVIDSAYKRGRGLDFKQSFNLNFHYSLKSIAGINPKAAMLDIMSNMLQLTYNNAAFWGGANRYFPNKPIYPFPGGNAGMNAWYQGNPVGFLNAFSKQIKDTGVMAEIGKFFSDLSKDPLTALKNMATGNGALQTGMKLITRGKAPDIVGMKSLLTGEPIGEWHMVVGNPYSPTMMIGNLICTGAKFQFNDILGADNFPTELKVTITMEHGRPRDKGDIESMFNSGEGRIYYAPANNKEIFNSSAMANSRNDDSYPPSNLENAQAGVSTVQRNTNGKGSIMASGIIGGSPATSTTGQTTPNSKTGVAAVDTAKGVGNDSVWNGIVDSFKDLYGQGHDLAIKMGLASAGAYKADPPNPVQSLKASANKNK